MQDELKPCPFCGGEAEIADNRYHGTGASGMETPEPYARCKVGCIQMKPISCTDWPWGKGKLPKYKEARKQAIAAWNTRADQTARNAVVEAAFKALSELERINRTRAVNYTEMQDIIVGLRAALATKETGSE